MSCTCCRAAVWAVAGESDPHQVCIMFGAGLELGCKHPYATSQLIVFGILGWVPWEHHGSWRIPCTSLQKLSVSLFGLFTKAGMVFSNLGAIPPSVSSDPTLQVLFATCLDLFQGFSIQIVWPGKGCCIDQV